MDWKTIVASFHVRLLLFVVANAVVPANVCGAPLFESDETLSITITAPMRHLLRHRRSQQEYDAVLSYTDAAGAVQRLNIKITTRGHSRLESCDFPPLRLIFDPEETRSTVFKNQRRVKMVTQCKSGTRGKDWLSQEFGIYRATTRSPTIHIAFVRWKLRSAISNRNVGNVFRRFFLSSQSAKPPAVCSATPFGRRKSKRNNFPWLKPPTTCYFST